MRFVDQIEFTVASGDGGPGCSSFRRERFVPRGGPDGGDGGKGGDLVFEATTSKNTLVDFYQNFTYKAPSGEPGRSKQMTGASGEDLVLEVPVGTMVFDANTDELLADLSVEGTRWSLPGGDGGKGNVHFKSATRRTPRKSTPGRKGVEQPVRLELKLIADVGLLGFPNAGKSTFISRVSNAKPKVANYPFTTLVPTLGVVPVGDRDAFVIADIPGLIEGASDGHGLGHRFLRHVERCALYLHLVSASEPDERSPVERFEKLNEELRAYDNDLLRRPQIVCLTKVDLLDDAEKQALVAELEAATNTKVYPISSVSGEGVKTLLYEVWGKVKTIRATED